jgi:hypothetical protein
MVTAVGMHERKWVINEPTPGTATFCSLTEADHMGDRMLLPSLNAYISFIFIKMGLTRHNVVLFELIFGET